MARGSHRTTSTAASGAVTGSLFEAGPESRPAREAGFWSVGALIAAVGEVVQSGFSACSVRGEVSGFSRAASGHCYFNLKDPQGGAMLRCAMFRRAAQLSAFVPGDGDAVELRGRLSVYEPRGELQLVVEAARRSGAGALYERFLRLQAMLEAEGLFDPATRRPLPSHPASIGVVTSLAGAALHDVTTALARRSPHVAVVVYASPVQGVDAPQALCRAIALAGVRREVELLIVCRGGGSLEDLWAFNDERVARAIKASPIPVVSGVGHETDITLADLAADLRAPTPTAAAELAAPATQPLAARLASIETLLSRRIVSALEREQQRLDRSQLRLASPGEALRRRGHAAELAAQRLGSAAQRLLADRRGRGAAVAARLANAGARSLARLGNRLDAAALGLAAVDPTRVLGRGYALLSDPASGRPLVSAASLRPGDPVRATLADGSALLRAERDGHATCSQESPCLQ